MPARTKIPNANLILARERLGLSRVQLAEMLNIDRTVIYKVEMGWQGTPLPNMERWATALGQPLDVFRIPTALAERAQRKKRAARA